MPTLSSRVFRPSRARLVGLLILAVGGIAPATAASAAVPSPPTAVVAAPATSQAQVSWTTPSSAGGSPITGYTVTPIAGSTAGTPVTVAGTATSTVLTGLQNGTSYTFTVSAANSSGTSSSSAPSAAIVPDDTLLDFGTPALIDGNDPKATEVGVKFTSDVDGQLLGIRFFKAPNNTGTHVGSLWTLAGQRLAQVTFTGESASGWQTALFASPVTVAANTTYIASYYSPGGHYSFTAGGFNAAVNNPPLHAPATSTTPNGIFAYGPTSTFPTRTYNGGNYWVDALFAPAAPPGQPQNVQATGGQGSASLTWTAPAGAPATTYTITPYIGTSPQTPATTVTGGPAPTSATVYGLTAGQSYSFTVTASNSSGSGPPSTASNTVAISGAAAPGPPTGVSATGASSQASVSWAAPSSNGGSPIQSYTVTPYVGSTPQAPVTVNAPATSSTITGLTNGTPYTFTVRASNGVGSGPESAPSASTVPLNTIFDFTSPATLDSGDANPVEVGVKFTADASGYINGVRFYKATTNIGTHVGNLWTAAGQNLASATFTGETSSGWQSVLFANAVAVNAGTTYVASYFAPKGHYSATAKGLTTAVDNGSLHALANATSPDGVYTYSAGSTFPTSSYNASNYWVDVMYTPPSPPGQVTNASATAGSASASVQWTAPSTGGAPTTYVVTPYIGSTAQSQTTVTGTPPATSTTISGLTAGQAYTFTVQASNISGAGPVSAQSNTVVPTAAAPPTAPQNVSATAASSRATVTWSPPASSGGGPVSGYTVTPYVAGTAGTPVSVGSSVTSATITGLTNGTTYTFTVLATSGGTNGPESAMSNPVTPIDTIFDATVPAQPDAGDASASELGVKFSSDVDGTVTGVRFYKSATNTGTHVGNLWSTSGQKLASASFQGETGSGWQTVTFSTPVAISAGTVYIASYYAPSGHYSATSAGFSNAVDNPPLHGLSNATSVNGVYVYSSASAFPTKSYNGTNYWVDPMFIPAPPPGQPSGVVATPAPGGASLSWTAPTSGGKPSSYIITPYLGSSAQASTTVAGAVTTATVSGLTPGQSYTFTVQAANSAGQGPVSGMSNAVVPTSVVAPDAPANVSATPASNQALVSWSPPVSNGGSAIASYTVTPYTGPTAGMPVTVSAPATQARVTGLATGTAYTFTVAATNAAGASAPSSSSAPVVPAYTLLDFMAPLTPDGGESNSIEVGTKFTPDTSGTITGIRFYKVAANVGTHIGNLWTQSGQRLAQATFTGETPSGWQTVTFATPVAVTAGTTYVASYFAPNGHYSTTAAQFSTRFDNPPLHAPDSATSPNGVYLYSATSAFPTNSYNASNYFIDVLFAPSTTAPALPGIPLNVNATVGESAATVNWSRPWDGGSAITRYTVTPYLNGVAQPATTVAGGAPPPGGATVYGLTDGSSYTFTVTAVNAIGSGPESAQSAAVTPAAMPGGQWSPLINWPGVAIHSVLTRTGRILSWDGWQVPTPTSEWDVNSQNFVNQVNSNESIFCSTMVHMSDGRILVIGGYGLLTTGNLGINDANIYDPTTGSWSRVSDMHYPRWYAGLTELPDGRHYLALSGKSYTASQWAETPEVYDAQTNTWSAMPKVNTSGVHETQYPNTYLLPNGNVFTIGLEEDRSFVLDPVAQTWSPVGGASGVLNGASVMYRPGKILYAGGTPTNGGNAYANAAVIDATQPNPAWQPVPPMANARAFQTMVVLADGKVLAAGGEPVTGLPNGQGEISGGVLPTEIWNPDTQTWTTTAPIAVTRGYHTSMMLLPDGRVWMAGSGHSASGQPSGQYNAQLYSPPYLFNGPRPTITSAPAGVAYGSQFTVNTANTSSIGAVNLVDLPSSTHQMDWNQHFAPLSFTQSNGQLTVTAPSGGAIAPPGDYMLFVVGANGVPSVASIVHVDATVVTPSPPSVAAAPDRGGAARVMWSQPRGGTPVTTYTVTPYAGDRALKPTVVRATMGRRSAIIRGLRPGTEYRFRVQARNAVGAGRPSKLSNAVLPRGTAPVAFIQSMSAFADRVYRLPFKLAATSSTGDRLVVETSIWGGGATASRVADSAGDQFTEVLRRTAADGTEMSVWTAPVRGDGIRPTILVTPSSRADVGAVAAEYSGLSTADGLAAVDRLAVRQGVTRGNAVVSSGRTARTSAPGELGVGFYADSGFGDLLRSGRGWSSRANVSPSVNTMEQLVSDRIVTGRESVEAVTRTGARTPWLAATVVFRRAGQRGAPAVSELAHLRATSGSLVPLHSRSRPHAVAGGVDKVYTRGPDGKLQLFFCLLAPSGKPVWGRQVTSVPSYAVTQTAVDAGRSWAIRPNRVPPTAGG